MNTVTEVTPEQYAQMIDLLGKAQRLLDQSKDKRKRLTLDQRVELMREADRLKEQALRIGK